MAIDVFAYRHYAIDPASRALATLLSCFGQYKIPIQLLYRARAPYVWDVDGEIAPLEVNMVDVVQNSSLFERALCELSQLKAIYIEQRTDATKWISVDSQILMQISYKENHSKFRTEAVKAVFYAFPLDRCLEPQHSFSIATSILPLLRYVQPYMELIDVQETLPAAHIVEVYLSASYYSTLDWKNSSVSRAESIAARYSLTELQRRVKLRKNVLSRVSLCKWRSEMECLDFPRVDRRSNGFYGEFVLFNADILFGRQQSQDALAELDKYTPLDPGNVSTIEKIRILEMNILRGKIYHFSGYYTEANKYLENALYAKVSEMSITCKISSHLAIVQCELGKTWSGINIASLQLDDLMTIQSRESGSAKRLRLTLAYTYLIHSIWAILPQPTASLSTNIQESLDKAQELFQGLVESYGNGLTVGRAGRTNRFSSLLGLALIAHIKGDLDKACNSYDIALNAASLCNWDAGYIEAIIYWSKSVVLYSLGEREEAEKLDRMARSLYRCRSYFFPGIGNLWPEVIRTQMVGQGRDGTILEIT